MHKKFVVRRREASDGRRNEKKISSDNDGCDRERGTRTTASSKDIEATRKRYKELKRLGYIPKHRRGVPDDVICPTAHDCELLLLRCGGEGSLLLSRPLDPVDEDPLDWLSVLVSAFPSISPAWFDWQVGSVRIWPCVCWCMLREYDATLLSRSIVLGTIEVDEKECGAWSWSWRSGSDWVCSPFSSPEDSLGLFCSASCKFKVFQRKGGGGRVRSSKSALNPHRHQA